VRGSNPNARNPTDAIEAPAKCQIKQEDRLHPKIAALQNSAGQNQSGTRTFVPACAKSSQDAQFGHGSRIGVMGNRTVVSPAADIHGERPDAAED
jgi:hypothetical protein